MWSPRYRRLRRSTAHRRRGPRSVNFRRGGGEPSARLSPARARPARVRRVEAVVRGGAARGSGGARGFYTRRTDSCWSTRCGWEGQSPTRDGDVTCRRRGPRQELRQRRNRQEGGGTRRQTLCLVWTGAGALGDDTRHRASLRDAPLARPCWRPPRRGASVAACSTSRAYLGDATGTPPASRRRRGRRASRGRSARPLASGLATPAPRRRASALIEARGPGHAMVPADPWNLRSRPGRLAPRRRARVPRVVVGSPGHQDAHEPGPG